VLDNPMVGPTEAGLAGPAKNRVLAANAVRFAVKGTPGTHLSGLAARIGQ